MFRDRTCSSNRYIELVSGLCAIWLVLPSVESSGGMWGAFACCVCGELSEEGDVDVVGEFDAAESAAYVYGTAGML